MRISDWSSDVCSSDLSGSRAVDTSNRVVACARPGSRADPKAKAAPQSRARRPIVGSVTIERIEAHRQSKGRRQVVPGEVAKPAEHGEDIGEPAACLGVVDRLVDRSEEHTSELQSLMRISYAVFCLKKKTNQKPKRN